MERVQETLLKCLPRKRDREVIWQLRGVEESSEGFFFIVLVIQLQLYVVKAFLKMEDIVASLYFK